MAVVGVRAAKILYGALAAITERILGAEFADGREAPGTRDALAVVTVAGAARDTVGPAVDAMEERENGDKAGCKEGEDVGWDG